MTTTQRRRELSGPEVEATLAAIRRRVRARHGLPPDGPDEEPAEARSALTEAMDAAYISAHTPILWTVPIVGRALALVKRVVRLLLRWYINPIVDQQNDFNAAAVRALNELAAGQEALRREIERRQSGSRAVGQYAGGVGTVDGGVCRVRAGERGRAPEGAAGDGCAATKAAYAA